MNLPRLKLNRWIKKQRIFLLGILLKRVVLCAELAEIKKGNKPYSKIA